MMIRRVMLFLAVLLSGCGGTGRPEGKLPELHQARGRVTRAGQPVAGGFVQFRAAQPDAAGRDLIITSAVGTEGGFELATTHALSQHKASGAPAGDYKATYLPPGESQDVMPVTLSKNVTIAAGPNDLTIELDDR